MHKAYKEINNYQADVIEIVRKNLLKIGDKNKGYLEKQVKKEIDSLVKANTIEEATRELFLDTLYAYDNIGGYLTLEQLGTLSETVYTTEKRVSRIIKSAPTDVTRQYKALYNEVNKQITKGELTIQQAVRQSMRTYVGQTIRYSNGNNYPTDAYFKMLFKTNQRQLCELRANETMKILDTDIFEYSSHSDPRKSCSRVQGLLCAYDRSGYTFDATGNRIKVHNLTLEADYGEAYGAQGVNCTHLIFAFIPGVSKVLKLKSNPIDEMAGDVKETSLTKNISAKRKENIVWSKKVEW